MDENIHEDDKVQSPLENVLFTPGESLDFYFRSYCYLCIDIATTNQKRLNIEEHDPGIFDGGLDLFEKGDGFFPVDESMVVSQRNEHDRTNLHLSANRHRPHFRGVHSQDGGLRWVDNGRSHEGTEDAAIRNGKRASVHVLDREVTFFRFLSEFYESSFDVDVVHFFHISDDGDYEALGGGDSHADVDEVAIDDLVAVDDGVDDRLVLQSVGRCLQKRRHEA